MSFYMGRINNKTVLSLSTDSGEAASTHTNPSVNTIFHSDMPNLFVVKRHIVTLAAADANGYCSGTLGTELANKLSNKSNVLIPVLVYTVGGVEYYKQMHGIAKSSTYAWVVDTIVVAGGFGGAVSQDLNLEWGYYSGSNILNSLNSSSNGGYYYKYNSDGDDYAPGQNFVESGGFRVSAKIVRYNSSNVNNPEVYKNILPKDPSNTIPFNNTGPNNTRVAYNLINPDYMYPLGPSGSATEKVYVRAGGSRNFFGIKSDRIYSSSTVPTGISSVAIDSRSNTNSAILKGSMELLKSNGWFTGISEAKFAIVPTRLEYLELNVSFSNTGGYTATNIFRGDEIKISNTDFLIKGVNMRTAGYELLTAVQSGSAPSYGDNFFLSNYETTSATALSAGASFRLSGVSKTKAVNSVAATNIDGSVGTPTNWFVGTYKFPTNSSVLIDSRVPRISMAGIDIWSPTSRPLLLFSANSANNVIIGDNTRLYPIATNASLQLGSANLGLPGAGASVVLMSLEWMSNDLCSTDGDPGLDYVIDVAGFGATPNAYNTTGGVGSRLTKMDYDKGDGVSHQIIVLNSGAYVPIFVTNSYSYSSGSAGRPKSRFQYYLRKNPSSGVVEFWACSRASKHPSSLGSGTPWIQFPKLRLNIQRLV